MAGSDEVRVSGVPVGADDAVTLVFGEGDDAGRGAGRIVAVEPGGRSDVRLAPGLVDIHCHGGGGHEFGRGDGAAAAATHHAHGTTTVVASLVSSTDDRFRPAVDALAPLVAADVVAGIHLEGPFLGPVTVRGARAHAAAGPRRATGRRTGWCGGREAGHGDDGTGAGRCR